MNGSKEEDGFFNILASNLVFVPIPRHTWLEHPVVKVSFWEKVLNDPVEAGPAFKYLNLGPLVVGLVGPPSLPDIVRDNDNGEILCLLLSLL